MIHRVRQQGPEDRPPLYSPDGRYWWNGQQWLPVPQTGGPGEPPSGPGGPGQPSGEKPRGPRALIVAIFIIFPVAAMLANLEADKPSRTAAADVSESGDVPEDQAKFLAAVGRGQKVAADGNELQVVEARKERTEGLCAALGKGLAVKNWVGEVSEVATAVGGDSGVLELTVAEDVTVGTWNNGFSDLGANTLIDPSSSLWDKVAGLEEGDLVYFTGRFDGDDDTCVTESSMLDVNGMRTPQFIMEFTDVGLVDDGKLS